MIDLIGYLRNYGLAYLALCKDGAFIIDIIPAAFTDPVKQGHGFIFIKRILHDPVIHFKIRCHTVIKIGIGRALVILLQEILQLLQSKIRIKRLILVASDPSFTELPYLIRIILVPGSLYLVFSFNMLSFLLRPGIS